MSLAGLRFGILHNVVEDGMEGEVARPYARALALLEQAGAKLVDLTMPEIERMPQINAKGGLTASEAYAWHQELIASDGPRYDPLILKRIMRGEPMSATDYLSAVKGRAEVIAEAAARTAPFDAVLCPTVPLAPPPIAAVAEETRVQPHQPAAAAEHDDREFPRSLRDQPALPPARRGARPA
jgi:aspartyl-tRNA(Asn)/glutamyl-tRNA(Gln) amidotransferase subunit A